MRSRSLLLVGLVILVASCGPAPDAEPADLSREVATEALRMQPRELRLRVDGLTVWLAPELAFEARDGARAWLLRGRTGANLRDVHSFILDDGFGRARIIGPRSFEVALDGHELNSLLSGLRLFVTVTPQSDRLLPATIMVQLGPELVPRGTSSIAFDPTVRPIRFGDELRYRGDLRVTRPGVLVATASSGTALPTKEGDAGVWHVDFPFEVLEAEAASRATARVEWHGEARERARFDVRLAVLNAELFRGPPEARDSTGYGCAPHVQACLDAVADGTLDYAGCGTYREVSSCNVPSALPWLQLIEHEEVQALLEAAAAARARLLPGRSVYVNTYAVQGQSAVPPSALQAMRAWRAALGIVGLVDGGPLSRASWQAVLEAFGARAIIDEAAQAVYGGEEPSVISLHAEDGGRRVTFLLAHYPIAARLVAIELVEPAP